MEGKESLVRSAEGHQESPGPESLVCVAVDGSRAARQAVLWGAVEARLRRAPLLVVHVDLLATDSVGDSHQRPDQTLLEASARAALELEPDISVRTGVVVGTSIRAELVALSRRASVLALGIDPTRPRAAHGALGPIEDYVAVHASCPVVVVAPLSFVAPGAREQVTVGWTDGHTARLALEAAAEEAWLRGTALSILTVPPTVDPQLAGIIPPPDQESALIDEVGRLEDRHPGLLINITHRTESATTALRSMAPMSELLVLGCHHTTKPWSIRTGPVAAGLMRESHCPVMLVGRRARQHAGVQDSHRTDQHSPESQRHQEAG